MLERLRLVEMQAKSLRLTPVTLLLFKIAREPAGRRERSRLMGTNG